MDPSVPAQHFGTVMTVLLSVVLYVIALVGRYRYFMREALIMMATYLLFIAAIRFLTAEAIISQTNGRILNGILSGIFLTFIVGIVFVWPALARFATWRHQQHKNG